jgi:VWFA-related protein
MKAMHVSHLSSLAIRVFSAVLGAFLTASPGVAQTLRLAQPNAARFPEVTLFAYPTDARGVLLGDLDASSFRVTEDDAAAQILRVENDGGEMDVCLTLDLSGSMLVDDKLTYARNAAVAFIRQLGPKDRAAVLGFAGESRLIMPLSDNRNKLVQAALNAENGGNGTALLDAVHWSISQVALRPEGITSVAGAARARPEARRLVVALTDGLDNISTVDINQAIEYARANGVSICTVSLGADAAEGPLMQLAQETGGVFLRAPLPGDLERLYAALAEQLRKEYRITYRTPVPEKNARRRVVKVALTSTPLTAETWYQAPGQGSLLVTAPSAGEAAGASPLAAGDVRAAGRRFLGAAVAFLVVVGGGSAAFIWWLSKRRVQPSSSAGGQAPASVPNPWPSSPVASGPVGPVGAVAAGPQAQALWVRAGTTRIGRGRDCDLVLDSSEVSRHHARIETMAGGAGYLLVDEESRNGTFLNDHPVKQEPLRPGDLIRFGDREFRFAGVMPE